MSYLGDSLKGSALVFTTKTFEEKMNLELYHFGRYYHLDVCLQTIWLFNDRMLGIDPARDSQSWIAVF
ncbi:hypothetical protein [Candidatus Thioglobus sp.]|jgi:hypothetical protein|uniref:hypothetical protein n=1 Tax=Candidatus Thioglobus sp. TaxID=2026721 RepID=UPI001765228B|nr:hypothetical protein [Candidatus Thioglobus sp.]HIF47231.1 hypothetical protein [Candidatus Thioglobus sp.]